MPAPAESTPVAAILAASRFSYRVGDFQLGPLDLEVLPGQIHALLGPNGSGKTTLLRACQGLLPADVGSFYLFGQPVRGRPANLLNRVGYVPDDPEDLIAELTAPELWDLVALARTDSRQERTRMRARADELAAFLDFAPPRSAISAFSHGMRKKTQVAAALMASPSLIILDEPRNGLDPVGILRLEALMSQFAARGAAVLVSSHDLHWAARIADRVHIMHRGQVLVSGRPGDLQAEGDTSLVDTFMRLVQARP